MRSIWIQRGLRELYLAYEMNQRVTDACHDGWVYNVWVLYRNLKGVQAVSVALIQGTAEVTYSPDAVSPEHIVEEVEDTGFDAEVAEVIAPEADTQVRRTHDNASTSQQESVMQPI